MSYIFLMATEADYLQLREAADAILGYPSVERATASSLPPPDSLPVKDGKLCISLTNEQATLPEIANLLTEALAGGVVEQITEEEFVALFPPPEEAMEGGTTVFDPV